jgi:hypothetical protein
MKRKANEIIAEIKVLLDELEGAEAGGSSSKNVQAVKKVIKKATGCIGAIQELIDEGFFEAQKTASEVIDKLKEEGQPSYSHGLVSMNLLNLVKRKVLRRVKENDQWQYILRK